MISPIISARLQSIEQNALQTLRDIEFIRGFCTGMEMVADDYTTIPSFSQLNLNGNEFDYHPTTSILEEIKAMIVELNIKASVRERANGLIELRSQALGSIYGRTKEEIERKLNQKLREAKKHKKETNKLVVPIEFDKFAIYWFENFHKRKVAEKTYKKDLATYKRDIQNVFDRLNLTEISPIQIQNLLDSYSDKGRTKETIHSLLNQILKCAIKHGIIKLNPLDMCFYQKHDREHGQAIPKDEEKRLLDAYAGTPFQLDFAIVLYTGLRPNEYRTAVIDGDFIRANNSKRKNGRTEYKRIPIGPMLRPYLKNISVLKIHHPATVTDKFKEVLPNYKIYDMRTTFQTRCTECGVDEVAIGLFMGNSIGSELKKAYTDVSDEWLIQEMNKLIY